MKRNKRLIFMTGGGTAGHVTANLALAEPLKAEGFTCMYLGMPECNVHLSEAVVFCSLAPKSNALYTAYEAAAEDARRTENEPVPMQLRNAPTKLMKQLGYGEDYQYAHDYPGHITPMICMPDSLIGKQYYHPSEEGSEKRIKERKEQIEAWKKEHRK